MKDHEIAKVINDITHVARVYGQTQQIRERLRAVLEPVLKEAQPKRESLRGDSLQYVLGHFPESVCDFEATELVRLVEKTHGIGD